MTLNFIPSAFYCRTSKTITTMSNGDEPLHCHDPKLFPIFCTRTMMVRILRSTKIHPHRARYFQKHRKSLSQSKIFRLRIFNAESLQEVLSTRINRLSSRTFTTSRIAKKLLNHRSSSGLSFQIFLQFIANKFLNFTSEFLLVPTSRRL